MKKKRLIYLLLLIAFIISGYFIFKYHPSNATPYHKLYGESVPENVIINPEWEAYQELSLEEKAQVEVVPSQYVWIYDLSKAGNNRGTRDVQELPSSFDLRNVNNNNYVSPYKNQKSLGLCWAFAGMSSFESTLLMTRPSLSYYQDLNNDGIKEDASNVITFSERQIDYATATKDNNLSNFNPYSVHRELGSGGNWDTITGLFMSGISPKKTSYWGDYDVSKDPIQLYKIFDNDNIDLYASETVEFPFVGEPATEEYKETVYDMVKKHLMQYGAVWFTAGAPFTVCLNTEYNLFVGHPDGCENHAMSIIGWIDSYGPNNEPVWIVKNSWSNQEPVYYPMSKTHSFAGVISINDKDWDNNYDASKKYEFNITDSRGEKTYEIKYYKNPDNDELLNYIAFNSYGQDTSYDIYVSNTGLEEDYVYVKTQTKAMSGMIFVDVGDIELNGDSFLIKVSTSDGALKPSSYSNRITAFTTDVYQNREERIGVYPTINDPVLSSINNKIVLDVYTKYIPTGEEIEIKSVKNSNNEDVSNLFDIEINPIINDYANGYIYSLNYVPDDTYTFVVGTQYYDDEFSLRLVTIEGIGTGLGTIDDPYTISTVEDLIKINSNAAYLSSHYILLNDLDLSVCKNSGSVCYNNGNGWLPIGSEERKFKGTFNGDNHTINNLYINRSNENNMGLFGYVENGNISDLNINNVEIHGYRYIGALTGYINNNTDNIINITNIFVSGDLEGDNFVSGVAGYSANVSFNNCGNKANIVSRLFAGGIASRIYGNVSFVNVYNQGNISGKTAGGIIGRGNIDTLNKAYNTGVISGETVGGLVADSNSIYEIKNSFNTGTINASVNGGGIISDVSSNLHFDSVYNAGILNCNGANCGSIIGSTNGVEITADNTYYYSQRLYAIGSDEDFDGNINSLTKEQLINSNSYVGFDFNNTWEIINDNAYPTLISIPYRFITRLTSSYVTLSVGESSQLEVAISPRNATNKKLVYTSSNKNIVTVDEAGLVTGVTGGNAVITVKGLDNSYPQVDIQVTVLGNDISVEGVSFYNSSISLNIGEDFLVEYSITPTNATNQNVTFTSSNTNVVTVTNDGLLHGVSPGVALITIKTEEGNYTDTLEVTVLGNHDKVILESEKYTIDNVNGIIIIPNDTSLTNFLKNVFSDYDINYKTGLSILGTGAEIKIMDNKTVIKKFKILVYGDINGDGLKTLSDIMSIARYIYNEKSYLSGVYLKAADYTKDNKHNLSDIMTLSKDIYGGN